MRKYTLTLPSDSVVIGNLFTMNTGVNSPCISINGKVCGSTYSDAGGGTLGSSAACVSYLPKGINQIEFTGRGSGLAEFRGSIFVLPN